MPSQMLQPQNSNAWGSQNGLALRCLPRGLSLRAAMHYPVRHATTPGTQPQPTPSRSAEPANQCNTGSSWFVLQTRQNKTRWCLVPILLRPQCGLLVRAEAVDAEFPFISADVFRVSRGTGTWGVVMHRNKLSVARPQSGFPSDGPLMRAPVCRKIHRSAITGKLCWLGNSALNLKYYSTTQ